MDIDEKKGISPEVARQDAPQKQISLSFSTPITDEQAAILELREEVRQLKERHNNLGYKPLKAKI